MTLPERLRDKVKGGPGGAIRPRDAATLIILDTAADKTRILMGRRRRDLAFMAGKYVFPGGRLDADDPRAPVLDDLPGGLEQRLLARMRGRPSSRRARGLALTAIRETFEETGILIGRSGEADGGRLPAVWQDFLRHGIVPTLAPLRLVARAITPPGRPRRFDTRFFMTVADAIGRRLPLDSAPDGELEDICWLTFGEARDLDLPDITHVVLDEIEEALTRGIDYAGHPSIPFYHMRHGRFVRDMI
ncbi:MAG: NUDIX domain-containing protein [Rhodobiaceae bacterium]|nr:NUDIX domain-containing protein [Rhodobiaceae bacterium]